jgi:hypothetical protein
LARVVDIATPCLNRAVGIDRDDVDMAGSAATHQTE